MLIKLKLKNMCLLDFIRTHIASSSSSSANLKFQTISSSLKSTSSSSSCDSSECKEGTKNLTMKQSLNYPEFMLSKSSDDIDTLTTSLQDDQQQEGSHCTDFIYASGICEDITEQHHLHHHHHHHHDSDEFKEK